MTRDSELHRDRDRLRLMILMVIIAAAPVPGPWGREYVAPSQAASNGTVLITT